MPHQTGRGDAKSVTEISPKNKEIAGVLSGFLVFIFNEFFMHGETKTRNDKSVTTRVPFRASTCLTVPRRKFLQKAGREMLL